MARIEAFQKTPIGRPMLEISESLKAGAVCTVRFRGVLCLKQATTTSQKGNDGRPMKIKSWKKRDLLPAAGGGRLTNHVTPGK